MRIDVTRSGGLAGMSLHASVDSAEMSPDEASAIEQALNDVDFAVPAGDRPATGRPDRFQYDLAVTDGDERRELSAGEQQLPAGLRQILDRLLREASQGG